MKHEEMVEYTDHKFDYHRFINPATQVAKELPWTNCFIEIGTRAGGGALLLLEVIKETDRRRPLITIDPYGEKPYMENHERVDVKTLRFGDDLYREAMRLLSNYASAYQLNWMHLKMLSRDAWITLIESELWFEGVQVPFQPGFTFIDGDHSPEAVVLDMDYAATRTAPGGRVTLDDFELFGTSSIWEQATKAWKGLGGESIYDGQMLHWRKSE